MGVDISNTWQIWLNDCAAAAFSESATSSDDAASRQITFGFFITKYGNGTKTHSNQSFYLKNPAQLGV